VLAISRRRSCRVRRWLVSAVWLERSEIQEGVPTWFFPDSATIQPGNRAVFLMLQDSQGLGQCSGQQVNHPDKNQRVVWTPKLSEGNQTQKDEDQPAQLLSFVGNPRKEMPRSLPFKLSDYLERVDWTGCILREGKRSCIAQEIPPILERLQVGPQYWSYLTKKLKVGSMG
jgi:hypothetical protein